MSWLKCMSVWTDLSNNINYLGNKQAWTRLLAYFLEIKVRLVLRLILLFFDFFVYLYPRNKIWKSSEIKLMLHDDVEGIGKHCLLLGCSSDLGLLCASNLLHTVLLLLGLLPWGLGSLGDHSLSGKSVLGLKFLGKVHGVVDEGKAGGLSAAEVGLEAKGEDAIGCALVHLGNLFGKISVLGTDDLLGWRTSTTICRQLKSQLVMYWRVCTVTVPSDTFADSNTQRKKVRLILCW